MKTKDYVEKPTPTKLFSVRVPVDLLKSAMSKAKKEGLTLAEVIVAGLKKYLKE